MKCFLSYRRADLRGVLADVAREMYLHFEGRLGRGSFFWDHESIPEDSDWQTVLRREIEMADVVLALIGPEWIAILKEHLQSTAPDYVRFELEHARRCNKAVVVVPLQGASVPDAADLPATLRFLSQQQSPVLNWSNDRDLQLLELEQRLIALAPAGESAVRQLFLARGPCPWRPDTQLQLEGDSAWWEQWNFHDAAQIDRLAAVFARQDSEPNVVALYGRFGSGRRFLVEAAVRRLRRAPSGVLHLQLDLDGYETTEYDALRRYLNHQGTRLGVAYDGEGDELISWIEDQWRAAANSLDVCATCGLLLHMTRSFRQVQRLLEDSEGARFRLDQRLLTSTLRDLSRTQRVVVHAVDSMTLPCTLREDLLSVASESGQIVVVLSGFEREHDGNLSLGRRCVELDVPPLERASLEDLLADRCGSSVPAWLSSWLWSACRGHRGKLALLLRGLAQSDVLDVTAGERWHISVTGASANILQQSFHQVVLCPVEHSYRDYRDLQRVLQAAAVCGEVVPLRLVCQALQLNDEATEQIIDVVDDRLLETAEPPIFHDLQFNHPGLSHTSVYHFLSPLLPEMLLAPLTPDDRASLASTLLSFLEKHLPPATRAAAALHLHLARQLPHRTMARKNCERSLAWWIGVDDAERLQAELARAIDSGDLSPNEVWEMVLATADAWPDRRRLALLLAYESSRDGVALDHFARFCSTKGLILFKLAQFEEAESLLRKALDLDESSFGSGHPNVAADLNNLAQLLTATNRFHEAEPLSRRALAILVDALDEDNRDVATVLDNLALLLAKINQLDEAECLFRRALAIVDRLPAIEQRTHFEILNNLSHLLKKTGRLHEAESLQRRALELAEESFGVNHPTVAVNLDNLAQILLATQRVEEAEPLIRRALAILEQSFGPDHPEVAVCLMNLSHMLSETNRLTEAEGLLRRGLAITEKAYGPWHREVAVALDNLGGILMASDHYDEAEPLKRRALAVAERALGPFHPTVAVCLRNLATLLARMNRRPEMEPLLRRALEIDVHCARSMEHTHVGLEGPFLKYSILLRDLGLSYVEIQERLAGIRNVSPKHSGSF